MLLGIAARICDNQYSCNTVHGLGGRHVSEEAT